ncbi:MAG: hypothetical protein WBL62_02375 [Gallionella sp.]
MNNIKLARHPFLLAAGLYLASSTAQAALPLVEIKTYGQHIGGKIVYQYQLINNSVCRIGGFSIAHDTDYTGIDMPEIRNSGELNEVFPIGYDQDSGGSQSVDASSVSGLLNWDVSVIQIEDSGLYLAWYADKYADPSLGMLVGQAITPGQSTRFSVSTPKIDTVYVKGDFSVGLGGTCPSYFNGKMQNLDTTPPVLSVTLTPATITAAQRGQMIPVTATITVKDDYDPAPEIKLVSVLADDPANGSDIQGDAVDTDDRSFSVRAARFNPAIMRSYIVVYSATDASGNTTTVSTKLPVN